MGPWSKSKCSHLSHWMSSISWLFKSERVAQILVVPWRNRRSCQCQRRCLNNHANHYHSDCLWWSWCTFEMSLLTPEAWSARMTWLVPTCRGFFGGDLSKTKSCCCQNLRIFHACPPAPCPSPAPWPWQAALFWTCSPWSSRWGSLSTHSQSGAGAWNCRELTDEDEKWKTRTLSGKGTNREAWSYHTWNFFHKGQKIVGRGILTFWCSWSRGTQYSLWSTWKYHHGHPCKDYFR